MTHVRRTRPVAGAFRVSNTPIRVRISEKILISAIVCLVSSFPASSQPDTDLLAKCVEHEKAIVPCKSEARFHRGDTNGWTLKFVCETWRRFALEVFDPSGQRQEFIRCDGTRVDTGGDILWDARALDNVFQAKMDNAKYGDELRNHLGSYFAILAFLFPTSSMVLPYCGESDTYLTNTAKNASSSFGRDMMLVEYGLSYDPMKKAMLRETYDLTHAGLLLLFELFPNDTGSLLMVYDSPLRIREDLYIPQEVRFLKGYAPGMSLELIPGTFESGISPAADTFTVDAKGRKTIPWSDEGTRVHRGAFIQAGLTIAALAILGAFFVRKKRRKKPV